MKTDQLVADQPVACTCEERGVMCECAVPFVGNWDEAQRAMTAGELAGTDVQSICLYVIAKHERSTARNED